MTCPCGFLPRTPSAPSSIAVAGGNNRCEGGNSRCGGGNSRCGGGIRAGTSLIRHALRAGHASFLRLQMIRNCANLRRSSKYHDRAGKGLNRAEGHTEGGLGIRRLREFLVSDFTPPVPGIAVGAYSYLTRQGKMGTGVGASISS